MPYNWIVLDQFPLPIYTNNKWKGEFEMALIKCPECGKEVSDLANACPGCGYPLANKCEDEHIKDTNTYGVICPKCGYENQGGLEKCDFCGNVYEESVCKKIPRLLSEEEMPEMFKCYKCDRPLPVGIKQCPYCKYIYGSFRVNQTDKRENTRQSNVRHDYNTLRCPKCFSTNVNVISSDNNIKKEYTITANGTIKEKKKEKISAGKTILGIATMGMSLPLVGVKDKNRNEYHCLNCGNRWKGR